MTALHWTGTLASVKWLLGQPCSWAWLDANALDFCSINICNACNLLLLLYASHNQGFAEPSQAAYLYSEYHSNIVTLLCAV